MSVWSQDTTMLDATEELEGIQALLLNEVDLDILVDNAFTNSHQLKMDEALVRQQHEVLRQEKRSWIRSFRMGVNFFNVTTSAGGLDSEKSITQASVLSNVGLTIGLNPEDLLSRKSRIRVAEEELRIKEIDLQRDRRDVKAWVINRFLKYQEALEIYIIRENALMMAEENKHIADEKYRQGRMKTESYNQILGDLMLKKESLIMAETNVMQLKREIELFTGE